MVIIQALAPAKVGGLERVVCALARGHRKLGHDVHVVAMTSDTECARLFRELAERNDVPTTMMAVGSRQYIRERREFASVCRELNPDIVHTHGYRPDVLDAPIARKLGIPTLTTIHGFTGGGLKNRIYENLQARAAKRFDAVVAVSEPIARKLESVGVRRDRMHVLHNAWTETSQAIPTEEARRRLNVPDSCFHIGWVGRVSHEKGPDVFIRALARLKEQDVLASIIGSGAELARVKELAGQLGVGDLIRWHGIVPDAGRVFRAFDLYVISSRTEGTPITMFEAVAAQVPIVATTVGALPDVLSDGQALLVPPEDPDALASAMQSVRQSPTDAAQRAAAASRRLREEFALTPWLKRYERLYESVRTPRRGR